MMFDMPASYLAKKPDMTLYNMMKVEIDFSLRTADSMVFLAADDTAVAPATILEEKPIIDATVFEDQTPETLQLPDEAPPAQPESTKEEDNFLMMLEFGFGAVSIAGALCFCILSRKGSQEEGGQKDHLM